MIAVLLLPLLWYSQRKWSTQIFGSVEERGPIGPLRHLECEAREAQEAPHDIEEYADCLLLLLDATWRAGFSLKSLIIAACMKHLVNRRRVWPVDNEPSDSPVFHSKEETRLHH